MCRGQCAGNARVPPGDDGVAVERRARRHGGGVHVRGEHRRCHRGVERRVAVLATSAARRDLLTNSSPLGKTATSADNARARSSHRRSEWRFAEIFFAAGPIAEARSAPKDRARRASFKSCSRFRFARSCRARDDVRHGDASRGELSEPGSGVDERGVRQRGGCRVRAVRRAGRPRALHATAPGRGARHRRAERRAAQAAPREHRRQPARGAVHAAQLELQRRGDDRGARVHQAAHRDGPERRGQARAGANRLVAKSERGARASRPKEISPRCVIIDVATSTRSARRW